mmetsp:Transcript_31024/g.73475  ORF Transcript_31024/g.73475 Transcript_31024/m.73475 type:complete len:87 (+) Transcript_31024:30-290(+)
MIAYKLSTVRAICSIFARRAASTPVFTDRRCLLLELFFAVVEPVVECSAVCGRISGVASSERARLLPADVTPAACFPDDRLDLFAL